ncbi:hypothetical protein AB0910_07290 [Streptomyces sp. NPDC047002]|uniref:hypothetical protein n=1 Tax=Streptomyces sp. NPDC047002 TaxID=3155475 RepID=UPI0034549413
MTLTRRRLLTGAAALGPLAQTLQVALAQLNGAYVTDYSVVMAGTLVAIVPLVVVFLIGARHFVGNIAAGALKG